MVADLAEPILQLGKLVVQAAVSRFGQAAGCQFQDVTEPLADDAQLVQGFIAGDVGFRQPEELGQQRG
jgi:hypothetical protein